jgi:multiple antibiotic resistance protein
MGLLEYALLAFSSLFVIVDPIAVVPTFLAITAGDSADARVRMARMASIIAALVLAGFGALGQWVFHVLGITMPAFQVAGGIILFMVAMDMLRARRPETRETPAETEAGAAKADIAVTPLAMPLLAGPGACSTVLLLQAQAHGAAQIAALYLSIALVCAISFLVFWFAARQARHLNPIAMRIVTRLMGLLLAAIAAQFVLDGVSQHWQAMNQG